MTGPAPLRRLRLTPEGWLDDPALLACAPLRQVFELLNRGGEEARVVGGAVRNSLIDHPVSDIDVATTAEPETVMARARAAGLRAIPTGLAHGTVTLLVDGTPFEVTTLRRDVETDGRHAVVRFSRDFRGDAQRRDFTINALSLSADGVVHDDVGGLADLVAGHVRFIGDPDQRITEDYLRILRFFRFHAAYGAGPPDAAGVAAAERHRGALVNLSRERIRAELLKLLVAPGAAAVMESMAAAGIARLVVGLPVDPARLSRIVRLDAARSTRPDGLLRLAALSVHAPADADRLRDALRLSNDEWRRLGEAAAARAGLDPATPPGRAACLALLFTCGERAALDGVTLAEADAEAPSAGWVEAAQLVSTEPRPCLPIGGADLLARGVTSGRRIGVLLKLLQAAWIRAGFPHDPATLAALIDSALTAEAASTGPVAPP